MSASMSTSSLAMPVEVLSPGDLTYGWQEDVEDLTRYREGGYHPVHIQDQYSSGRYLIVHRLGFGTYSTIWLARDQHMNRYAALKIVVAEASKTSSEGRILRHLRDSQLDHPGRRYNICLFNTRPILHRRSQRPSPLPMSEPARRCIASSKEASTDWMFEMGIARMVAAQAIFGLQYIHSRGVVHGDLHIRNILFRLPRIDSLSIDQIYHNLGEPQMTLIKRADGAPLGRGVPSYSVMPAQLVVPSDDVTDPRIVISDFVEAWFSGTESRNELNTPVLSRPPETFFSKTSIGSPVDVWTLGCTLYEILGERPLFEGFMPDTDDVIAEMISCLGLLPDQWWQSWQAKDEFFLGDGSWKTDMKRSREPKSRPLLLRIEHMGRQDDPDFSKNEKIMLEEMLRAMLQYDPSKRATIGDAVESDWFRQWGLPALQILG